MKLEQITEGYREDREARAAKATQPDIQVLADFYHRITCTMDHTERCAYHYGNWDNDIRFEMIEAYESIVKFTDRFGAKEVVSKLDAIKAGEQAKKDLSAV